MSRPSKDDLAERRRRKREWEREKERRRQFESRVKQGLVDVLTGDLDTASAEFARRAVAARAIGKGYAAIIEPTVSLSPAGQFMRDKREGIRAEAKRARDLAVQRAMIHLARSGMPLDKIERRFLDKLKAIRAESECASRLAKRQATIDLLRSDIPLDEMDRWFIAQELWEITYPDKAKHAYLQAKAKHIKDRIAELKRRGHTTTEAYDAEAEGFDHPSGDALRKFVKKYSPDGSN